jgi:WD40 repeat protein
MSTFEITLQRKIDNDWPAIGVFSREGDFLPIRTESRLELDVQGLLRFANPRDYGKALGKALFRDNLRDALARAQTQAREDQTPLRILLNVEAEDLKPLHWERLCAPLEGVWDFLCLNQSTPFSLYLPSLTDRRFPPIGRRDLRALVLVASPEELDGDFGLAPFDIPATIASLRQSFGDIPHDILAAVDGSAGAPTLEALCECLTAGGYSLLHIVCHGRYSPRGETILYLPDSRRRPITAAEFIERIARLEGMRRLPHFTFLMTCESASPEAENGFGGLGQRLVRELGMPAVLAMTAPISIKTGSELAGRFYSCLSYHGEVDRALSEALAGLMGRPDAIVPAVFSRLGGRPIFSDALDRPLTPSEVQFGLELLGELVSERAPALQEEYTSLFSKLHEPVAEVGTLSAAARQEYSAALEAANTLSDEIADINFNALALGRPVPPYDPRCPFRGLAPFRPEDRSFFFGREDLVQRLLERLDAHPFLAVLGPSGSGKSSLVLAGLVPALNQRAPGFSEEGPFAYLTSGADPVPRLEAALAAASDCALVVIDQFEELFTICRDDGKRGEFIRRILSLSPARHVVLTMRADFWGECASYPALKDEMQAHQELVAPLDPAGMRRAIEQQAATVGLRFEADLAEDILDDVHGEPGAMPLLQHALLLLWERRHGRWLRSAEYRSFGGVQQAIAHTADGIYLKLDQAEQEGMRNIFLRLTRLDEDPAPGIERRDTRRRVALDELVPAGSERSLTVELVNRLADARLVVTGVDPISNRQEVEVAHEALIHYWKSLQSWLEEDRSTLRRGERVREAAQQWQESQRDESLLVHRGSRLEDVLEIADRKAYTFNQIEIDYLTACQELRQRERRAEERRRRQWLVAAVFAAVIFAVLAGYGFRQAGQARSQAATATFALGFADAQRATAQAASTRAVENAATAEAEKNRANAASTQAVEKAAEAEAAKSTAVAQADVSLARQLVAQASELLPLQPNRFQQLVLISIESLRLYPERGANQVLAEALQLLPKLVAHMNGRSSASLAFSPDGKRLVLGSDFGTVDVWEVASEKEIAGFKHGQRAVRSVAFSQDGQRVVSGGGDGIIRVWDVASREEVASIKHGGIIRSAAFSPDGKRLASVDYDGTIRVWDVASGEEVTYMTNPNVESAAFGPNGQGVVLYRGDYSQRWDAGTGKDLAAAFNPDGRWVVSFSDDGTVQLWDKASKQEVARLPHDGVRSVGLSPDGQRLASVDYDGTIRVWDVASGEEVTYKTIDVSGSLFEITPDGQRVVSRSNDGTIRVWDVATGEEIAYMISYGAVQGYAFSPDGQWVVWGSLDGSDRGPFWVGKVTSGGEVTHNTIDASGRFLGISPDGQRVVSDSGDGTIRVWDVTTGKEIASMPHAGVTSVIFSPNGQWAGLISKKLNLDNGSNTYGIRVWDAASGEEAPGALTSVSVPASPSEAYVSISNEGKVRVWDVSVKEVYFSPDGQRVVSVRNDGAVQMWETASEKEIASLSQVGSVDPGRESPKFVKVAFSPGGQRVVLDRGDGAIRVWDVASGKEIARMAHDGKDVAAVAFSPDGQWIVDGSSDGTVRVWDVASGKEVARMTHEGKDLEAVAFSPDGRWIVDGSRDGTVRVWLWRSEDLIKIACDRLERNLTQEEWKQYMGEREYHQTCSNLPPEK